MSDKEFVPGLYAKAPHENAPDFVKVSLSIKRAELGNWLRSKSDEFINVDIKVSQGGKWYGEVNNFVPDKSKGQNTPRQEPARRQQEEYEDIPF